MALPADLIDDVVLVGRRELVVSRPRDSEALLDEDDFGEDERLPYWADLWPSGVALAEAVVGRALGGTRVLELGCGLAVPSLCAALAGATVTATDWSQQAIELVAANAARNGVELEAVVCSWQQPALLTERAPWDVVLAADVLYERRNLPLLLELLPALTGERGEIWLADPDRALADEFLAAAADGGWKIATIARSERPRVTIRSLRPGRAV